MDFSQLNKELSYVNSAMAVLSWDQEVYLPLKGQEQRAHTQAFLSRLYHRMLVGQGALKVLTGFTPQSARDEVMFLELKYQHEQAVKVPEELVGEMSKASSTAYHAWVDARKKKDFLLFAPHLEVVVALHRRLADCLGFEQSPYDALLNQHERGMKASDVALLFDQAKPQLMALFKRISAASKGRSDVRDAISKIGHFPSEKQHAFSMKVLSAMGYDFDGGRVDKTVHPFMVSMGKGDVRITYRVKEDDLFEEFSTIMHEGGHALYEQGFNPDFAGSLAYAATSTAIHESQSRTWENIVGKSEEFWKHFFLVLKQEFGSTLAGLSMADVIATINDVRPHFIRIESDELTYNFHIFLRFEIERALIEGTLRVEDVPSTWNEKMQQYLGITPPDDALGCLQDVHWAHGIGYFSTYALGNFYAAQFMHKAQQEVPGLWTHIEQGNLSLLREWQRNAIHRRNDVRYPLELCKVVTGEALTTRYFVEYLERKFSRLYGL